MRRWLTAAGLVVVLGAGGVACASGEEAEEVHEEYVGAGEVCDGLFAGPLAKMVEDVTGQKLFSWRNVKGMEKVVKALKEGYASGRTWAGGADLCRLHPKGAMPTDSLGGAKFSMYAPHDVGDFNLPVGSELYTMGKQSEVGRSGASLYFECVTPQLRGSRERPLRILGHFGRGESNAPDTRAYRDTNLRILHAVSLKLVKEFDCENNGGLPKTPVLTPK
ncbi:hypothetical protein OG596_23155 [Streptomyces sp. NBC_01102]|uniref:hypothetical protein n=1 Tax=unclassified Streptomyces TaxID=2593676 RepID=UPI0038665FC5|nr:hypothetical protein OG596_23155 [Streptomyces sp. NBC_01102]